MNQVVESCLRFHAAGKAPLNPLGNINSPCGGFASGDPRLRLPVEPGIEFDSRFQYDTARRGVAGAFVGFVLGGTVGALAGTMLGVSGVGGSIVGGLTGGFGGFFEANSRVPTLEEE